MNIKSIFGGKRQPEFVTFSTHHHLPIDSSIIANNFLKRSLNEGIIITPLKLQKLVYFAYATYLKATGFKLFSEPFETWSKGPALVNLYARFASYGNYPIRSFSKDSCGHMYTIEEDEILKKCFDTVWGKYKNSSEEELSILACEEGTAWSKAYNRKDPYLEDKEIYLDGTDLAIIKNNNGEHNLSRSKTI